MLSCRACRTGQVKKGDYMRLLQGNCRTARTSLVESCRVKDLALQRFLDLWTSQLSNLRDNSNHLLDVLAVRHLGFRHVCKIVPFLLPHVQHGAPFPPNHCKRSR